MPLLIVHDDGSYRRPLGGEVRGSPGIGSAKRGALEGHVILRSLPSHLHIIARFPLGSVQQAAMTAAMMERHAPRRVLLEISCGTEWLHLICGRSQALKIIRGGSAQAFDEDSSRAGETDSCDRLDAECLPDLG